MERWGSDRVMETRIKKHDEKDYQINSYVSRSGKVTQRLSRTILAMALARAVAVQLRFSQGFLR
jgi:hypothetical protein